MSNDGRIFMYDKNFDKLMLISLYVSGGDTCCMGMNVKVWNMWNKAQLPQETP